MRYLLFISFILIFLLIPNNINTEENEFMVIYTLTFNSITLSNAADLEKELISKYKGAEVYVKLYNSLKDNKARVKVYK